MRPSAVLPTKHPAAPAPALPRAVVALSRFEREVFFPGVDLAVPGVAWSWLEDEALQPGRWETVLRDLAPAVLVTGWRTPPLPVAWLEERRCPLRYVCHVTGSVRQLLPRSFVARGGQVTNWGGLVAPQVAEHALLLALAALRSQPRWRDFLVRPPHTRHVAQLDTRTLHGRRVGVHGFGGVARALLALLRPFGVSATVFAAGVPDAAILAAGAQVAGSLAELVAASEVLFECEALTATSSQCITGELLARLPDGAVFVNVARGGLVDEAALRAEAQSGRLRVAVDVAQDEPITGASSLAQLPEVIVSPHIGGPTRDRYAACGAFALENLRRFVLGQPLEAVVTLEIYDRST